MKKIVFATNNKNKLSEIQHLLNATVDIVSLADIHFYDDIEETEDSLEGNASLKSHAIFDSQGLNVFSDDTGLEIEALNGDPGVYSARYAGEDGNAEANMKKVLTQMKGVNNRKACFRTVISLILEGKEYFFEGKVEGVILTEKHGEKGFGYDPIFQPEGYQESFAELPLDIKNSISHRGRAVQKLVAFLKEQ